MKMEFKKHFQEKNQTKQNAFFYVALQKAIE
jgi:hypothetical protein